KRRGLRSRPGAGATAWGGRRRRTLPPRGRARDAQREDPRAIRSLLGTAGVGGTEAKPSLLLSVVTREKHAGLEGRETVAVFALERIERRGARRMGPGGGGTPAADLDL